MITSKYLENVLVSRFRRCSRLNQAKPRMIFSKALAILTTSPWRSHLRSSWATTERQCLSQYCDLVLWPPRFTPSSANAPRALGGICVLNVLIVSQPAVQNSKPEVCQVNGYWTKAPLCCTRLLAEGTGHRSTGSLVALGHWCQSHSATQGTQVKSASLQCVGSLVWRKGEVAVGKLCRP